MRDLGHPSILTEDVLGVRRKLRFAPVGMTKERVTVPRSAVAGPMRFSRLGMTRDLRYYGPLS